MGRVGRVGYRSDGCECSGARRAGTACIRYGCALCRRPAAGARTGYYGAPPAYGAQPGYGPPAAYEPPPAYGAPPLLPPQEVYAVLRDNGFSPLSAPRQRGLVYVIAVVDRGGEDGKLVIDARNGRIIRFTPAFRWGNGYYGDRSGYYGDRYAPPPPYGPPGVLPPTSPISGEPRPPVSVPHVASRGVPLPQPKPTIAGRPPEPLPQKSAAVEMKPAVSAPKPAAAPPTVQAAAPSAPAAAVGEARPAPVIAPTQPMPRVQGLE
jgi:hypothetical protein